MVQKSEFQERETFTMLMNAVRESHETERNYNQRIKMISLIGMFWMYWYFLQSWLYKFLYIFGQDFQIVVKLVQKVIDEYIPAEFPF